MENKIKKYLDRVVMELVRGTEIDYENERIHFPSQFSTSFTSFFFFPHLSTPFTIYSFSTYCEDIYGLTEDEIEYVWEIYRSNILDKIKNG